MSLRLYSSSNSVVSTQLQLQLLRVPPPHQLNISFQQPKSRRIRIRSTIRNGFFSQEALGITITTALAKFHLKSNRQLIEEGEWTLFTSPTPFNAFLKLRCASILFNYYYYSNSNAAADDEAVTSGRIIQHVDDDINNEGDQLQMLSYQRICVDTDDGGVVSLDWPANLEDLASEHGLDTTVLIVPGTTDGSMDHNVRSYVSHFLARGCFPIVINPRGCARSPITTPRLFTAADSDDIRTAVQFINRARPWTTFMAVGFGYGANMLIKYIAQVGEETPLTAAVCLDNPFDLQRASCHPYVDHDLTTGLIDMLQSNKECAHGSGRPSG